MRYDRLLSDSYSFARMAHEGQFREDGVTPYIDHPASVAAIVQSYRGDRIAIASGNLHDVVEDTHVKLDEIERRFGFEVSFIVDGVTKIPNDKFGTLQKIKNYATQDKRVILVKMADRMHNISNPPKRHCGPGEYWESTNFYIHLGRELGYKRMAWDLQQLNDRLLMMG